MVSQSCEELMESEGEFISDQCDEFKSAAEAAGLDEDNVESNF